MERINASGFDFDSSDWSDWDSVAEQEYQNEDFDRWEEHLITSEDVKPGEKDEEAREAMYELYRELGTNNSNARKTLIEADSKKILAMKKDVDEYLEVIDELPEEERQGAEGYLPNVLISYVNCFEEGFFTDEFKADFKERIKKVSAREFAGYTDFKELGDGIEIAKMSGDVKYFKEFFDFYNELEEDPTNGFGDSEYNGRKLCTKSDTFRAYCMGHGMNDDTIRGFKENIIPMVDRRDPELEMLYTSSNSWGVLPGDYGISDFAVETLVSRVNPRNIRDLMQINRLIPTGDYTKYEQNRRDAVALQGTLWSGRDFIHDERPGIHGLFKAMIDMYDANKSGNEGEYQEKRKELEKLISEKAEKCLWSGLDGELALEIDNYDRKINMEINGGTNTNEEYDTTAIEILRRLYKNTEISMLEKPKTKDEELNKILEDVYIQVDKGHETYNVDMHEISKLVSKMNEILASKQGMLGIGPSMIDALSYTEKLATYALRGISEHDRKELPFDPTFKEIVRFSELTSSPKNYSEKGFEQFYKGFLVDFSREWNDEDMPDYSRLVIHEMENVAALARKYRDEGKPDYMIDSLWSGNLVHELIGLTDSR